MSAILGMLETFQFLIPRPTELFMDRCSLLCQKMVHHFTTGLCTSKTTQKHKINRFVFEYTYTARNITDLLQAVDFTELAQAVNIK